MEHQDKLFEQFKKAAHNAETKEFPGMDKVWSRVENKLDNTVLIKKNNLWKKIAVAASILLVISIGYQFLKSDSEIIIPKNEVAFESDTIHNLTPKAVATEYNFNTVKITDSIDKTEAKKILNAQIDEQQKVATVNTLRQDTVINPKRNLSPIVGKLNLKKMGEKEEEDYESDLFLRRKIYDAIGVRKIENATQDEETKQEKPATLVVIDGKAITNKNNHKFDNSEKDVLAKYEADEIESVMVLKEPLYIINGVHYSEEELFGKNPTSPYAPLDKQEIEKIEIIQDAEAVEKYGKKGEKGVVIIATKNGKPFNISSKK